MVVTNKLKFDTPLIHMGGISLNLVDEIKILGVIIDKKLTFNSHIKYITQKAINIYKPLARSAKISWGLNPEIIRTMYVSVIEPIILYAASAWAPAASKRMSQKVFNSVQRGFAQKICKAYRTTSLHAVLVLAGLLPLDLRVQENACVYEAKRGKPQTIIGEDRSVEKKTCFLSAPHPADEETFHFASIDEQLSQNREKDNDELEMFTDGSKIKGRVGAALTIWKDRVEIQYRKFRLESYCTVFQAEAYALYRATEIAINRKEKSVSIFSDSKSVLQLVSQPGTFQPLAFAIRQNMLKLKRSGKEVRLNWIRAHVGTVGNERADVLAKAAALAKKSAPDYDRCQISYIKRSLRQETVDIWNSRYQNGETAAVTKTFLPTVPRAYKALKKVTLSPMLVQVLTGHGGFAAYLHRFKCKESPACICDDDEEESIIHLLLDCPQHTIAREDLQQEINLNLCKDALPVIFEKTELRDPFLRFCTKVAKIAIERNKATA